MEHERKPWIVAIGASGSKGLDNIGQLLCFVALQLAEICHGRSASRLGPAPAELRAVLARLDRCIETFPIAHFRELLGVPPGAYDRGNNFARFVIQPAMLEVNGLSDMSIDLVLVRRSKFTPIEAVTVTWWQKEGDEFRVVMRERDRSKVGRMARLRGVSEAALSLR
jgi:hypothetical protein